MTAIELDAIYTDLCKTMTQLGEGNAPLFLSRLALLTISHIGDVDVAQGLIRAAAQDIDVADQREQLRLGVARAA